MESSFRDKSDKLKDICNDTNKRLYGFIKTQETIRQVESQAREANVDLNQFMQSANTIIAQSTNFTLEKQDLNNKIISMEKVFAEKEQAWKSEQQYLQEEISKLKKELKVTRKKAVQGLERER